MFSAKLLTAALAFGGTQAVTIQAKPIMDYKACKAMCSTYPGFGKSRDRCFDECMYATPRLAQTTERVWFEDPERYNLNKKKEDESDDSDDWIKADLAQV